MQPDLIFCPSEDAPCRLLMPSAIVIELDSFKQTRSDHLEAGGILLGLRRGPHLEVVAATRPMKGDKRGQLTKRKKSYVKRKAVFCSACLVPRLR